MCIRDSHHHHYHQTTRTTNERTNEERERCRPAWDGADGGRRRTRRFGPMRGGEYDGDAGSGLAAYDQVASAAAPLSFPHTDTLCAEAD
eukprot:1563107-Rhodomonas_salina.1